MRVYGQTFEIEKLIDAMSHSNENQSLFITPSGTIISSRRRGRERHDIQGVVALSIGHEVAGQ